MNALVPPSLMRPSAARFNWTDEAVKTLIRLCADGYSASQIALQIGLLSRNAVIGKATRLGLKLRGKPTGGLPPTAHPVNPAAHVLSPTSPGARIGRGVRARSEKQAHLRPDILEPFIGIEFVDIKDGLCRWPKGDPGNLADFRFCGVSINDGAVYCPCHARLAFIGTARPYARSIERNKWLMKA